MSAKKVVSIVVVNGKPKDLERVTSALNTSEFNEEYSAVVSAAPMEFETVEQMVETLEAILTRLKKALPDQGTLKENPLFPRGN
jgi:nitrate reductase NapAB chaperone NapD